MMQAAHPQGRSPAHHKQYHGKGQQEGSGSFFKYIYRREVVWFNPSQQLSTMQLLAHSPQSGMGEKLLG